VTRLGFAWGFQRLKPERPKLSGVLRLGECCKLHKQGPPVQRFPSILSARVLQRVAAVGYFVSFS